MIASYSIFIQMVIRFEWSTFCEKHFDTLKFHPTQISCPVRTVKQTVIKSRQAAPVGQQRVVNQRWNHAAYRFTMRLMTPLMNCKSLAFISPDGRDEMMQRRLLRTPTCLGGHRRDGIGDAGRTPTSASSAFDVSAGVDLMSRLCARPGYLRERRWEKWRINSPVLAGALIELHGNIQIKWNNISWAIRELVRWNALNVSYKIKKQFFLFKV